MSLCVCFIRGLFVHGIVLYFRDRETFANSNVSALESIAYRSNSIRRRAPYRDGRPPAVGRAGFERVRLPLERVVVLLPKLRNSWRALRYIEVKTAPRIPARKLP